MTDDYELAYFKINMFQAEIRMSAMVAENTMRAVAGNSPAYVEADFMKIIDEHGIHHNAFPFCRY